MIKIENKFKSKDIAIELQEKTQDYILAALFEILNNKGINKDNTSNFKNLVHNILKKYLK